MITSAQRNQLYIYILEHSIAVRNAAFAGAQPIAEAAELRLAERATRSQLDHYITSITEADNELRPHA